MKITSLKINNFGKLKNKEINFSNNINIIYGQNESGKSTLLKFITAIFYGLSKNKNGKETTDIEKYIPWQGENYSGKLKYELDNKEQYEIYREFKKKEPKIFNQNLEEISEQFNIDKTKGNQFFYNQTGIDEELFLSTIVAEQQQLKLDSKNQSTLIQKLSNIASTGKYNISYEKIINKLNKKQLEEIGTRRSQDRPINIIENKIEQLQQEKETLEEYKNQKYEIENEKIQLQKQLEEKQELLKIQQNIQKTQNENKIEKEKIKINENEIEKCNQSIQLLEEQLEKIKLDELRKEKEEKEKKQNKIYIIVIAISIIISTIALALIKNNIIKFVPLIFTIAYSIVNYNTQKKKQMWITKNKKEQEIKKEKIKAQIEIIEQKKQEQQQNIIIIENIAKNKIEIEKQILKNKTNITEQEIEILINSNNIENKITNLQNTINEIKLEKHQIEIEEQNILLKLENMAKLEEQLANLKEQYQQLKIYNESIIIAKQEIEKAYEEMKQNITPKFIQQLSEIIKEISNGKYEKINFNEEKGIIVEVENGNYINANMLSIGTIDQLYLALRLSTIQEISKEEMPIMLDEAFTYFDDNRLENILKYLNKKYVNRQIFIFTCANREKQILEKANIKYNLIKM